MKSRAANFPWSEEELARRVRVAVRWYWTVLMDQGGKGATQDVGRRSAVTGGKQLDEFCLILSELAQIAGFEGDEVRTRTGIQLAGFFRPHKRWDMVVIRRDQLCAAIEFKSMASSYGNNLNNRTEEVLGSATDIWRAFKEGLLGTANPFIGYVFLMGHGTDQAAMQIVHIAREPFLRLDPEFQDKSYVKRAEIMCRRLVLERLYSSAAYLVSTAVRLSTWSRLPICHSCSLQGSSTAS